MKQHYKGMHWTTRNGVRVPKRGFATLDEALLHKRRMSIGKDMQPYVCDVCGMWHLGHPHQK